VIWDGLADGLFTVFSSDHAPFKYDAPEGKKPGGAGSAVPPHPQRHPGPGDALPLLYSEGVLGGRITLQKFVELTATNPAKAYGLHPRKGTIAIGSDADLVVWDERERRGPQRALHHAVDYTPYEGMRCKAWPGLTLSRGEVVWDGQQDFHRSRAAAASCPAAAHAAAPR
jgi:dihydropyrimidinase